jgi:hypothetical protein
LRQVLLSVRSFLLFMRNNKLSAALCAAALIACEWRQRPENIIAGLGMD